MFAVLVNVDDEDPADFPVATPMLAPHHPPSAVDLLGIGGGVETATAFLFSADRRFLCRSCMETPGALSPPGRDHASAADLSFAQEIRYRP
jgi:hypothetical protein